MPCRAHAGWCGAKLGTDGSLPEGIRNAIANLCTALVIQEASHVESHEKRGEERMREDEVLQEV